MVEFIKACFWVAVVFFIIVGVGQFGWAIPLGLIGVVIIVVSYVIIRVLIEWPE